MPKIDVTAAARRKGSGYPDPFHLPCAERLRHVLGEAAGLTQFGVNLLELPPGTWSSQRHWHSSEDEFIYVVSGELVLITDEGETVLRAGDCAGFPMGSANGHHLVNRSNAAARCLEVGTRGYDDVTTYSDIDMKSLPDKGFVRKDDRPYPERQR